MNNKWRTVPLSEIADINPRMGKSTLVDDELFSFVPMASVGAADGSIDVSAKRPYSEVKKGFTSFQSGDVLFAKITPCMENGKMAVVPHLENRFGFGSTEFHVIRPKDGIDPKFIYYYVSAQGFRKEAAHHMTGAVGQKRVPTDFLKQSTIDLPATIEDQERIVAEIEKQFSRLDEAVASLKRIQANLKRYKAAVLKAAVEGRLTEQWRKDHPDVEPAYQLLKRILTERRAKWEAEELVKMKTKGIKPKDESWKKKYKEPAGPDTTNLPELPVGWVWATIEQLTSLVTSGSRGWGDFYSDTGCLFIRAQDIKTDKLNLPRVARVNIPVGTEGMRSSVTDGDILVTITGANVTKSAIVSKLQELAFVSQHVALLKPNFYEVSQYLFSWIVSPANGRKILEKWAYGAGKPGLSLEQVRSLPVALPSTLEQQVILDEIDCCLSVTEEIESTIETNLKRAERLRQTILKQSFLEVALSKL